MYDVRLLKAIPSRRLHLVSGDGSEQPSVGDFGETDQCYTGSFGRQMVLVEFVTADGKNKWEAEAFWSELEEIEEPANSTLRRTGATIKRSWLQRWFGRRLGR